MSPTIGCVDLVDYLEKRRRLKALLLSGMTKLVPEALSHCPSELPTLNSILNSVRTSVIAVV